MKGGSIHASWLWWQNDSFEEFEAPFGQAQSLKVGMTSVAKRDA